MADFDEAFDARLWIREHGPPPERGCSLAARIDPEHLDCGVRISSCTAWSIPELGVGQGGLGQHGGFRGSVRGLLETARRDVERSRGLYGEAAQPSFDAALGRVDQVLEGWPGAPALTLRLRDPSGLSSLAPELELGISERADFVRSEDEGKELGLHVDPLPEVPPEQQLTTAADIAALIRGSSKVVAFTGAGISVESGIRPFRNPSDGDKGSIWGTFDAARMTVANFNADPAVTEGWWDMKRALIPEIRAAQPNPAHLLFADLECQGKLGAVVTQNIDSLHQRSGVSAGKVIELHGHMRGLVCSDHVTPLNPLPYRQGSCNFLLPEADEEGVAAACRAAGVPPCPTCGCPLRTETVMFGQPMPDTAVDASREAVDGADLLFVIGSTLIVRPANELPCLALRKGVPMVVVNLEPGPYDACATGLVREKAGEFFGAVRKLLSEDPETLGTAAARVPAMAAAQAGQMASPEERALERAAAEGTKRGREIARVAQDSGLPFFCTAVAEPEGDLSMLDRCLEAMNAECGHVSKVLFSAGREQLGAVAHVAKAQAGALRCVDWLGAVACTIGGEISDCSEAYGRLVVPADALGGVFPIKLKEPGIAAAVELLRQRGLLPVEDDDDDLVYGDDDFPSA